MSLVDSLNTAAAYLWGPATVAAVIVCGCVLSARLRFPQLDIREWWGRTAGSLRRGSRPRSDGITSWQTATAALAGTIGMGNIVGVASALTLGGAPAIFWMYAASVVMMGISYAENYLGARCRADDGMALGGPMVYIERGLGMRRAALVWAGICAAAAFGVGNITQVNCIADAARAGFGCPPWLSGLIVALLTAPAIFGGITKAVSVTEKLVPVMAALYIAACAAVIIMNVERLPACFGMMFSGIFRPRSVAGGIFGGLIVGVRRGVFSNEAGLGSSVMINSAADNRDPHVQGCWGMFEVFFDTIVMCTLTALALMTSGAYRPGEACGAMDMCVAAFECVFGRFSGMFITFCLLLFAFSTVICWSIIGERAISYLFAHNVGLSTAIYKMLYAAAIAAGAVMDVDAVWAAADIFNACLLLPNLAAVSALIMRGFPAGAFAAEKQKRRQSAAALPPSEI